MTKDYRSLAVGWGGFGGGCGRLQASNLALCIVITASVVCESHRLEIATDSACFSS